MHDRVLRLVDDLVVLLAVERVFCVRTANDVKEVLTLARLYRRQISLGTIRPDTTVVCDEISLLTHRDFECCLVPLARLGCQLLLLGDCENQLLSISVMLKSCVGGAGLAPSRSVLDSRVGRVEREREELKDQCEGLIKELEGKDLVVSKLSRTLRTGVHAADASDEQSTRAHMASFILARMGRRTLIFSVFFAEVMMTK